jgi:PBSX family phage terminase large subunit
MFDILGEGNYSYNKSEGIIKVKGRTIFVVGANDEKAESRIRGMTIAGAYCDEVNLYPESFFTQLLARASIENAKIFCNCNPDSPYHWFAVNYLFNDNVYKLGIVKRWHFTMEDNLSLSNEYKSSLRALYSGVFFKRFILGLWCMAEGVIYDMFREEDHIKHWDLAIHEWDRMGVAIDHGTQNATTFGLYGVIDLSSQAKMKYYNIKNPLFLGASYYHLIKSYYYSGRDTGIQKTDSQYADDLADFTDGFRSKLEHVIVDPEAAPFMAEIRKRDLYNVVKAKKDVDAGIQAVSKCLNGGAFTVDPSNKDDVREFFSYIWDPKSVERGKEVPLKQNDHCMDRNRYFIYTDSIIHRNMEFLTGKGAR